MLALGVGFLVLIDLIILVIYTLVEGIRGNLGAMRVSHVERPEEISGVSLTTHLQHVYDSVVVFIYAHNHLIVWILSLCT